MNFATVHKLRKRMLALSTLEDYVELTIQAAQALPEADSFLSEQTVGTLVGGRFPLLKTIRDQVQDVQFLLDACYSGKTVCETCYCAVLEVDGWCSICEEIREFDIDLTDY